MKKIIFMVLFLSVSLFAGGCGKQKDVTPAQQSAGADLSGVKIVTSFYPIYVMTLNITEDIPGVEVVNMTEPVTGCLHDYQLTPDDVKTIHDADIMVINGAGMESFMEKVFTQEPELKVIEASQGLDLINNESDGEPNPHLWVSISGSIDMVKNIAEKLSEMDPEHKEAYLANSDAYVHKLDELRLRMHQVLDTVPHRDIITFHEAFPYFAREFNLHIAAVVEREPGTEPSAGELARTIELIKKTGVKALFAEPQYSAKAVETIARESGANVYFLDPAVTGPMDADGYLKIMEENLNTLQEALH